MTPNYGFNTDGMVEPTTPFCYPGDEREGDAPAPRSNAEVIGALLRLLNGPGKDGKPPGPLVVGRRAAILEHLLDGRRGTQRALGKRLGLSPARTSELLNVVRRDFGLLAGLP